MGRSPTISNLQYLDRISRNHSQSNQITVGTSNFERNSGKDSRTVYCRPVARQTRSRAHRLNRKVDCFSRYQNCRKWKEQVRTDPRPQLFAIKTVTAKESLLQRHPQCHPTVFQEDSFGRYGPISQFKESECRHVSLCVLVDTL